jgi:hypothetical protein
LAAALAGGGVAVAQGGTPAATVEATTNLKGQVAYPAQIQNGSCAKLGDVAIPLSNVGVPATANGTPAAQGAQPGQAMGAADAIPVYVGITEIKTSIADLLKSPLALNVEQSGKSIACGDLGGVQYGDTLQFGLRDMNGSGYSGVALFSQSADGRTNVVVYVARTGGGAGTPAA